MSAIHIHGHRNLKWVIAAIVAVLISLTFMTGNARAAEEDERESITMSPASSQIQIDAGQSTTGKLTVVNDGNVAYDFIVYARPYSVNNSSYAPDFTSTPSNSDAYQWVQFAQSKYRLEAGKTLEMPYTIRVPQNATPGGHYGVLFAETQPSSTDGTSVARKKRVGSILYATVKGVYEMRGEVANLTIPRYQSKPPLTAKLSVRNTGNSHFQATTTFRVSDVFGNVKYRSEQSHFVLPQTTRDIPVEWKDSLWFGVYKMDVSTKFLENTAAASSLVLIAPRWLLLTVVVFLALGGIYALRRR